MVVVRVISLSSCTWSPLKARLCFSLDPRPPTLGDFPEYPEMYRHCSRDGKLEEPRSIAKEHGHRDTNGLLGVESSLPDSQGLIGTLPLSVFPESLPCAGQCVWDMETAKTLERVS